MPRQPLRPCRHPGCPRLSESVYCEAHRGLYQRENANQRGYDSHWRSARAQYLRRNPLCMKCLEAGKTEPSTVVDHVIPHRGDKKLFWDQSNWQALCKSCHDQKTGSGL